ncbi:MAG: hypothetical protein KDD52_07715 [Bdellovibrionales bacterium]|nr:hypothetical protein [Bdellovibrionales bacterium]
MVISSVDQLAGKGLESFMPAEDAKKFLLCPPEYFKVIDQKNPHMKDQEGKVNYDLAQQQWKKVKKAFAQSYEVFTVPATESLEDMVFSANPVFVGKDSEGEKICVLANMVHPSRRKEVAAFQEWFEQQGYRMCHIPDGQFFEGYGDALWHPGRRLIWAGHGFRSDSKVYDQLGQIFDSDVVSLKLQHEYFYHLDTCLSPISQSVALYFPGAFDRAGQDLIQTLFSDAIEVPEQEALYGFACNSFGIDQKVFIHQGNTHSCKELEKRGYEVIELDTSEFIKSGGSVSCMKAMVF